MSETPMQATPTPESPARRPIQFSLRDIFIAMTAACGVMAAYYAGGWVAAYFASAVVLSLGVAHYSRSPVYAILTLTGCLAALYLFAILVRPPETYRSTCRSNIKQITLALLNYEVNEGQLPPAYTVDAQGNRLHSWRTLILPHLEQSYIYAQLDLNQPWDAPANSQSRASILDQFQCPDHPDCGKIPFTSYVAVVGPNTMWPGERGRSSSEVRDGPDRTILIVEYAGTDIAWAEPRDLTLEEVIEAFNNGEITGICSYHTGGANVAFADCHVKFLNPSTLTEAKLRALLTIDDEEPERYP